MRPRPAVALALAAVLVAAAPALAAAALRAAPALQTRDGATRLVVSLRSDRAFTARTRPRAVTVALGATRLSLTRASSSGRRSVWRSAARRGEAGAALAALAGARVAVVVRSRAGTTTLRRALAAPPPPPSPPPAPPPPAPPAPAAPVAPAGERALAVALSLQGTPFAFGGASPQTGFDSPGLTQYAFAQAGVALPRLADQQFAVGTAVAAADLAPGDLVFFRDAQGDVSHVGISAGGGAFVHAPHTGDVVRQSRLDEPFYAQQLTGARRISG